MATVNGTSFADNLVGTSGADTMNGRAGNDVIRGGGGRDTITLGSGRDTAVYTAVSDSPFASNWDLITDFVQGEDRIDLTALLGATDLTWGGLTATANGVWYSRSGTTVSIFVDTNGAPGTPEMRIDLQNMSTTTVLTASDFTGVAVRTNAAPVISSQASWTVPENGTAIGTVVATDADSPTVTYSLVNGVDSARFAINPTTGALSFVIAPNFEVPTDVGANNVYNFTVQASDGTLNTTQAVTVTVTNVNEAAPVITSPATFTMPENGTAVGAVVATDADNQAVTYSLVTGVDSALFSINPTTGALSFLTAPNFEAPADVGANNVYNVTVQASDGTLNTTQAVAVTVTDVNETAPGAAPVFTSPAAFSIPENGTAVGTVVATDADSPTVTYSLIAGGDAAAFAINATTGAVAFVAAPNFEAPTDVGANNVYNFTVQASDGTLNTTQAVAVTVTDVNETAPGAAPVFTSPPTFSVAENSTAVGTVTATDADSPAVTYSLVTGVDSARFAINATTGALSFLTAPNFEAPADVGANNVYNVTVQASDGTLNTTQAVAVTVTDVNETAPGAAPVFTSPAAFSIPENGTAVGTVVATDADSPTVTYSLIAGGDAAAFAINATTGAVAFVAAPNFEAPTDVGANNVYNFTVQASDGTLNTTQAVAVTVTDVNETAPGAAPVFTSPAAFSIPENGTTVGTVVATDADSPTVTYSLVTGVDSASFAINPTTGALSFVAAPDFEAPTDAGANNVYNFTVQASDGTLNTTQAVAVTVTNVVNETLTGNAAANTLVGAAGNDIITGNGGADTLTGNGGNDTFVFASAQDSPANTNWQTPPDGTVTRVWDAITDFTQGADKIDVSAFLGATNLGWAGTAPTGNSVWYVNSGTTTFIYADIDNNPPPDVMIALQNRGGLTLTANDFIGVVGGFTGGTGAAPVFTSPAAFSIPENGTAVGNVVATDADSPTVTYSLVTGVDSARFAINATTGALSFVTAPNFEAPTDVGANNVYNFTVQASDGTLNTTQAVAVTVTDVNETAPGAAPVFTSPAAFSIPENGTAVGTVTATDADSPTVTYSLVTGVDSALFSINPTTGALSFVTAPNFEAPTDAGANNIYNVTVQAGDGTLNTTQAVAVTVTDVVIESIAGTPGNDTLTGTAGDDMFDISAGGNDTVTASSGTDTILAGAAFTAADRIDGGTEVADTNETDTLVLDGNYAAGVIFTAATLVNVEEIRLTAGNSYSLTTNDATVVAASLSIDGSALSAANTLTVNASAETEAGASYTLIGGAGNDVLTGGAGPDYFDISFGGNDIANGGAGRDTFYTGSALTAADQINGGAGTDFVYLNGDYSAGLTLGATTLSGIEAIVVQAGNNYSLTMNNAMLTGTQTATVDGFALAAGNTLAVNASAETDAGTVYTLSGGAGNDSLTGGAGNDLLNGNAGNDILVGGAGNDILTGGAGNDTMTGGLGNDVFDFNVVADRGTTGDTITDFSRSGANGVDVLNLHDLLLTFTGFNGTNAFTGGYLQFDTSSGTSTTVRVDTSGGANSYVALATLTGTLLQQTDTANYVL